MTIETINPWTGRSDYRYELIDDTAIEAILQRSRTASAEWARRSLEDRGARLHAVAAKLRERKHDIAALMTAEMGKLNREALAEIEKSAGACAYYADNAARYLDDQIIATEASRSYVRYAPLGCVFAIMPWNFPIWQVFRFLAPSLMAGNVAVLKHAVNVPRCADAIVDILRAADIPDGVLSVLHINNDQAARVIADPRVHAVTLTGSEAAGRSVAATAGKNLKKCVLELGGSDAFIVLADADLERTVATAVTSRFGNAGQTCIAAKRFIVVDAIAAEFTERYFAAASKLQVGDPRDAATTMAPMARADLRDALQRQVDASCALGARLLLGGEPGAGHADYPASMLDNVVAGMPAYSDELFGPVASILHARDDDDAVRIANDSQYGLGASVWTRDIPRGEALARRLDVGASFVNAQVRSDVRLPFGGTKSSGYGRELAAHGIHEFMNSQSVYVD